MKKVIFSVTKLGKVENTKVTGVGYITDEDLITANIGKSGKPYIRIYSCVKDCHPPMGVKQAIAVRQATHMVFFVLFMMVFVLVLGFLVQD